MKNSSRTSPKTQKINISKPLLWGVGLLVIAAISMVIWLPKASAPTPLKQPFQVTAADGVGISGDMTLPRGSAHVPAVILIHDFTQSRHQWDPYVQDFLGAGLAVIAYDVRGFGDSRLQSIPTNFDDWKNAMALDVPAVVNFAQHQSRIDARHINVVGTGLGAMIAYQASGSNLGLYRVVLLSPALKKGVLDGSSIKNFSSTGVLGISSDTETLAPVMAYIKEPKSQFVPEKPGSGVEMLKQPAVLGSVLSWLKQ